MRAVECGRAPFCRRYIYSLKGVDRLSDAFVSEPIKYNIYLKNRLSLFDITFTMNSCNTFDAAK